MEEDEESCKRRNGLPDGYHVQLWGLDGWVDRGNVLWEGDVDVDFSYQSGLLPYTRYMFRVYARNKGGRWNSALPLKLR